MPADIRYQHKILWVLALHRAALHLRQFASGPLGMPAFPSQHEYLCWHQRLESYEACFKIGKQAHQLIKDPTRIDEGSGQFREEQKQGILVRLMTHSGSNH